jgi:hypothetical protein
MSHHRQTPGFGWNSRATQRLTLAGRNTHRRLGTYNVLNVLGRVAWTAASRTRKEMDRWPR